MSTIKSNARPVKEKGAKDKGVKEKDGSRTSNRITPEAAVVAARAMIGNCSDELAIDVIEVVRPHLEFALLHRIAMLEEEIQTLRSELAAKS